MFLNDKYALQLAWVKTIQKPFWRGRKYFVTRRRFLKTHVWTWSDRSSGLRWLIGNYPTMQQQSQGVLALFRNRLFVLKALPQRQKLPLRDVINIVHSGVRLRVVSVIYFLLSVTISTRVELSGVVMLFSLLRNF